MATLPSQLPPGHCNVWRHPGCHNWGVLLPTGGRSQGAAEQPMMDRAAPITGNYLAQKSAVLRLRNPDLSHKVWTSIFHSRNVGGGGAYCLFKFWKFLAHIWTPRFQVRHYGSVFPTTGQFLNQTKKQWSIWGEGCFSKSTSSLLVCDILGSIIKRVTWAKNLRGLTDSSQDLSQSFIFTSFSIKSLLGHLPRDFLFFWRAS